MVEISRHLFFSKEEKSLHLIQGAPWEFGEKCICRNCLICEDIKGLCRLNCWIHIGSFIVFKTKDLYILSSIYIGVSVMRRMFPYWPSIIYFKIVNLVEELTDCRPSNIEGTG